MSWDAIKIYVMLC